MAVTCTERYFDSTCGTEKVRYLTWKDDSVETVGIYLIAHGVCEHIDRFHGVADFLAERGFVVYGEDHLGHGKTAATIDKIGELPEKADIHIVDDMHKLYGIAREEVPEGPVFLLGHSMGSFVAKIYSGKYPETIDGVVYCGTGDFTNLLRYIKKPFGLLVKLIGRNRKVLVSNNMLTTSWLSRSKENRADYLKDELITKYYTPGLIEVLGFLAADCAGEKWAKTVPTDMPILIVSGTQDIVGFCKIGVNVTEKVLRETGHNDVKKIFYKSYRHEILRDYCREDVYNDIYAWTTAKMK
ncbi:MAG: lysophospholipase [Clostridia bacterium]|nr:lysophospholipase [Clostridia bacterium]